MCRMKAEANRQREGGAQRREKQVWHNRASAERSWGGLISWWLLCCNSDKASCLARDGLRQMCAQCGPVTSK